MLTTIEAIDRLTTMFNDYDWDGADEAWFHIKAELARVTAERDRLIEAFQPKWKLQALLSAGLDPKPQHGGK